MSDKPKQNVRHFPLLDSDGNCDRVETGSIQFGNDWPSLHIRGDNAFGLAMSIDAVLQSLTKEQRTENFIAVAELESIAKLIRGDVIV